MESNQKLRFLIAGLVLFLLLILTACQKPGSTFTVINSNLTEYNLSKIPYSMNKITVSFNQEVTKADVVVKENGEQVESVKVNTSGKQVTISNLNLKPLNLYNLTLKASSKSGSQLTDQIEFITKPKTKVTKSNPVIMQTFYWEMGKGKYSEEFPAEKNLWKLLEERANTLSETGITSLWLPPANKSWGGMGGKKAEDSVGYSTYDLWDLGEFKQKGSKRTKYGTKGELESTVNALHEEGMKVYYDAVLNHRMGADGKEKVKLSPHSSDLPGKTITAWTKFNLKGRQKYYSKADRWKWNWKAFDGVDYANKREKEGKFLFKGKSWDSSYVKDYLMGADVDYQNQKVAEELKAWGKWIINDINFDGFRLDAVKHIDNNFIKQWINYLTNNTDKDLFFVGEVYELQENKLISYLNQLDNKKLKLFDFALRNAFENLRDGNLDLRKLADIGLVNKPGYQDRVVTFVDNHDISRDSGGYTQPITARKYQAYTYILMHEHGIPTIYWKDYYQQGMKEGLDKLITARQRFAHGPGRAAKSTDKDTFAYVRKGSKEVPGSGLVMLITKKDTTGNVQGPIEVTFSYQPESKVNSVSLAGKFNGWDEKADMMKDADGDGVYEVTKHLTPGEYPYKFVINGDKWIKPPEADKYKKDGYGGENGVVVVKKKENKRQEKTSKTIVKRVNSGKAKTTFIDYTGNVSGVVKTDKEGFGQFKVKASAKKGWSVWVPVD